MYYMEHLRHLDVCWRRPRYDIVVGVIVKFISSVHRCIHRTIGADVPIFNQKYYNFGFYSLLSENFDEKNVGYPVFPGNHNFRSDIYLDFDDANSEYPNDFLCTGYRREPNEIMECGSPCPSE